MGDRRRQRKRARRGLIGPLVMLAGGVAVGVLVWRFLMLDGGPSEHLSRPDRQALERLFAERSAQH